MTAEESFPAEESRIADAAANWVMRRDRGLTAAEQDELSEWLAENPRHRAAFSEHGQGWDELDRLAGLQSSVRAVPDPDLLAPHLAKPSRRVIWFAPLALAAAAAIAIGVFDRGSTAVEEPDAVPRHSPVTTIEERVLGDGSTVQLNRGSVFSVEFTPSERRVRLSAGEANFIVAKNPHRPFVVVAHGVEVKAVGTVFNVRLGSSAVEVIVTEGKVHVEHPDEHASNGMSEAVPLLLPGQHATVPLAPAAPAPPVEQLSPAQLAEQLAWQPRLLDFADAPLAEIAAEFNRHNATRLVLDGAALGAMRLSASFRSDNIEAFVRLMESDFGVHADRPNEQEIRLHK